MKNLQDILKFLNKVEKLKTIKRAISISDNSRKESPAEHTWRMGIMAMILHRELKLDIDLLKALEIILVHDIVEIVAGDAWILEGEKDLLQDQKIKEAEAAEEIYSLLPDTIGYELKELWLEFENGSSKEALFAKAIDKLEVIIQRCDLHADNWESDKIYETLHNWATNSVNNFPELNDLWKLIQNELKQQVANKDV